MVLLGRVLFSASLVVVLSVATVHCGGGTSSESSAFGDAGAGDGAPGPPPANLPPPTRHRVTAEACPSTRTPGLDSDAGVPDSGVFCAHDSECTEGTNGRCLPSGGQISGNTCSYDACFADTDCGSSNKVCECGTPLPTPGASGMPTRSGSRCLPGTCRIDADCGAGSFCSPSFETFCGPRGGVAGYYCHTPSDECTTDAQCATGKGSGYCAWQPTVGKWACSSSVCSG